MKPRSKRQLRTELERQGRWKEFVALREKLAKDGVARPHAWDRAAVAMGLRQSAGVHAAIPIQDQLPSQKPKKSGETPKPMKENWPVPFMPGVRVRSEDFKGKVSRPAEDLKWVAEHMFDRTAAVGDAPSATAWGLMMMCRSNTTLMENFWQTIWPRMLPSKAQFEEAERRFSDDGSSIVELCEKFKRGMGIKDDSDG